MNEILPLVPTVDEEIYNLHLQLPKHAFYLGTVIEDGLPVLLKIDDIDISSAFFIYGKLPNQKVIKYMNYKFGFSGDIVTIISQDDASIVLDALLIWASKYERKSLIVMITDLILLDMETQEKLKECIIKSKDKNIKYFIAGQSYDVDNWAGYFASEYGQVSEGVYQFIENDKKLHFYVPRI